MKPSLIKNTRIRKSSMNAKTNDGLIIKNRIFI